MATAIIFMVAIVCSENMITKRDKCDISIILKTESILYKKLKIRLFHFYVYNINEASH
jgi:hypothetical protein